MFGKKSRILSAAVLISGLLLSGCTSASSKQSAADANNGNSARKNIKIIVVTHGQAGDAYWSVVKHGVDDAARDLGVQVSYQSPQSFDISEMQKLVEGAIAQKPAGLALSVPDANALGPIIKKATDAGIPVVGLDSGEEDSPKYGAMTHVGASQYEVAKASGKRMGSSGLHKALCLNHEQGNASLDVRCRGFKDGFAESGGAVTEVAINGKDPTDSTQRIKAALSQDKSIDAMMALGPVGAGPMLAAAEQTKSTAKLASFDLSPEILQAIQAGKMDFAIDQQQYLMGYLPVLFLTQKAQYKLVPAQKLTPTGPAFITKDDAAQVLELSKQGLR